MKGIAPDDDIEGIGREGVRAEFAGDELDRMPAPLGEFAGTGNRGGADVDRGDTAPPRCARNEAVRPAPQAKSSTRIPSSGSAASSIARVFGSGPRE